jgi:hypothetical protein
MELLQNIRDKQTIKKIREYADQVYKDYMAHPEAVCNCGGPQYGTGHSPDCELIVWEDECWQNALEIAYDEIMTK